MILGCLFAYFIQDIQAVVEWVAGGSVWNPEIRYLTEIPARLRSAGRRCAVAAMALGLSFLITLCAGAQRRPAEPGRGAAL